MKVSVGHTIAIFGALALVCIWHPAHPAAEQFSSYDQVASSDLPATVLWKVIAREGKSKRYTDLLPLDGGTVGIPNFATGGLASLYRQMDTQKYFGRSADEMVSKYSANCRPSGKADNDTGWGCYTIPWWHDGMDKFLHSPEFAEKQNRAWLTMMQPVIEVALSHGCNDPRSLAIALGGEGFEKLAREQNWRPELVLSAYVDNDAHRVRRRDALNATFPPGK